ncbi:MAG: type II secretion system F family protein [Thermodesulfovibrionales bacterium]|nr:type II secretion system F family protein [Thermodesulfovibrionales bacterium]
MPVFKYKGYKIDGSHTEGSIEATTYNEAIAKIKSQGIFAEKIEEQSIVHSKGRDKISRHSFLPTFTRNLSILLESGVSLTDALTSLSAEYEGKERELIIAIKESISSGSSLNSTLESYNHIFPDFYITMVKAGEQSSSLERVLKRLAEFLESQSTLKAKVKNALVYPIFMLIVSSAVLSFIFVFVMPKITRIFKDTKTTLPFITKVLISISSFVADYWWLLFILLIVIVFVFERIVFKKREFVDKFLLKLPGGIIQSLYYTRFARTLAFLLEGGASALTALKYASGSTGNREFQKLVERAEILISEGQSMAASLKGLPPMFIQLISTGERTGKLFDTLNRAADIYEDDFNRKMARFISILEPSIIVIMGIIVCIIVLSILLPLFQMNQLIK